MNKRRKIKDYNTFARKLTPKWNRNDHQNRFNYIGMLVSHWASRRDTGLKDWYLSGILRYFLVAKNVWLVLIITHASPGSFKEEKKLLLSHADTFKKLSTRIDNN